MRLFPDNWTFNFENNEKLFKFSINKTIHLSNETLEQLVFGDLNEMYQIGTIKILIGTNN